MKAHRLRKFQPSSRFFVSPCLPFRLLQKGQDGTGLCATLPSQLKCPSALPFQWNRGRVFFFPSSRVEQDPLSFQSRLPDEGTCVGCSVMRRESFCPLPPLVPAPVSLSFIPLAGLVTDDRLRKEEVFILPSPPFTQPLSESSAGALSTSRRP